VAYESSVPRLFKEEISERRAFTGESFNLNFSWASGYSAKIKPKFSFGIVSTILPRASR
jgi:hypothetical protein